MKYKFTKEQLQEAVSQSLSIAETCRQLNIVPAGGNYKTLKNKLKNFEIDTSHFTGKGWNTGTKYRYLGRKKDLKDVLVENSDYMSGTHLKKRLVSEGILKWCCAKCGIDKWNSEPIVLELNHINGNNMDNRIKNLEILCPNCHSQTSTFRGKQKNKSPRNEERKKGNKTKRLVSISQEIPKPKEKLSKTLPSCLVCEQQVNSSNRKYCSFECSKKAMSSNIPTKEEILNAFESYKSFLQVGNYFKVSDNAVRKWCIKRGILKEVISKSSDARKSSSLF